ncbi:MAG: hypothetical protein AAFY02_15905 [Pseudomonadota bacterium]
MDDLVQTAAAVVAASATFYLAVAAVHQLRLIGVQLENQNRDLAKQAEALQLQREQLRLAGERERKWATLRACDRLICDATLLAAAKTLSTKTNYGTDYTSPDLARDLDLKFVLNQLESVALGIDQGLYIDALAYDHLHEMVKKMVRVLIKREAEPGTLPPTSTLFSAEQLPHLVRCYDRWFPEDGRDPKFKDADG